MNATESYEALNRLALIRAPRVMTRPSATWSATKQNASWCEADGRVQCCSPLSCGGRPLRTDCPVPSVAAAMNLPHRRQRRTVVRHTDRLHGECDKPEVPLRVSDVTDPLEREAALCGEPNAKVLRECSYTDEEIEMLRKESIRIKKEG